VSGGLVSVVVAGWRESAFVHGIVEFLLQYMNFWQNCLSVLRDELRSLKVGVVPGLAVVLSLVEVGRVVWGGGWVVGCGEGSRKI
jgi:hypothetical protein